MVRAAVGRDFFTRRGASRGALLASVLVLALLPAALAAQVDTAGRVERFKRRYTKN